MPRESWRQKEYLCQKSRCALGIVLRHSGWLVTHLARVVEPVLAAGNSVDVKHHTNAVPANGRKQ